MGTVQPMGARSQGGAHKSGKWKGRAPSSHVRDLSGANKLTLQKGPITESLKAKRNQ